MEQDGTGGTRGAPTRRRVLSRLGTGSGVAVGLTAGCIGDTGSDDPTSTESESLTFGLSTSLSDTYLEVGRAERRGFELAVEHLNEGGGLVESLDDLSGNGVLGRPVETTVVDTAGDAESARSGLTPHLESDELAMFCGGITGDVALEHGRLATEHEVPFFAGTSVIDSLTGENCSEYVYRELFPSNAVAHALGSVLEERRSSDSSFHTIYVDAPEGEDLRAAIQGHFRSAEGPGWENLGSTAVRPGSTDFSDKLGAVRSLRPSVVFCAVFGLDAVNLLQQATENLRDGTDFVVPVLDRSVGTAIESDVSGIIGTVPWNSGVPSSRSNAFASGYDDAYGDSEAVSARNPSGPVHLVYGQTLVYAAAAERAGTVDPMAVQTELEGMEYNVGLGTETMQACNHQSTRPVPVVQGNATDTDGADWFSILSVERGVVDGCDSPPASDCSM